jgi:hypothetical protein
MADLKHQHEKAVGDAFVMWLNARVGSNFAFVRAGEAPDLVYASRADELAIEVTTAYYDGKYAKLAWDLALGRADTLEWTGQDFDEGLASEIVRLVGEKATKRYGSNCLLLIDVQAPLTTADELSDLLLKRAFPEDCLFSGIYVAGRFPATSAQEGGYSVISVKPLPSGFGNRA